MVSLNNEKSIVFTTTTLLSPILMLYGIGVSTITLFDACLFIEVCCFLLFDKNDYILNSDNTLFKLFPFVLYLSFYLILAIGDKGVFLRTARYIFYVIVATFFGKKYFDSYRGIALYRNICVISTVFLIVQLVALKGFHFYISGYFDFLPQISEEFMEYEDAILSSSNQRCRSFFGEPSHYSEYVSTYLFIECLCIEEYKQKIFVVILLLVGLFVSTSNTGIIMGVIICLVYIIKLIKLCDYKKLRIFLLIILILLSVYCYSSLFAFNQDRLMGGTSWQGRFEGYSVLYEYWTNNLKDAIIGVGMISLDLYIAGWGRLALYFGIVGVFLIVYSIDIKSRNKMFAIFLIVMNMGTSLFLSASIIRIMVLNATILGVENNELAEAKWYNLSLD